MGVRERYTYRRENVLLMVQDGGYDIQEDGNVYSQYSKRLLPDSRYFPIDLSFIPKRVGNLIVKRMDILAYLKWGEEVLLDEDWLFYYDYYGNVQRVRKGCEE